MAPVFRWLFNRATEYGYVSLGTLALLDGSGLPIPAELTIFALVALVRRGDVALWPAIFITSAGVTIGSLLPYFMGRWGATRFVDRWLPRTGAFRQRLETWVLGYGAPALIVTRIIGFFRLATLVMAGALKMPLPIFIPAAYIGSVLWLYIGYHVARLAGIRARHVAEGFRERWLDVAILAGVVIVLAAVYWLIRRRGRNDHAPRP